MYPDYKYPSGKNLNIAVYTGKGASHSWIWLVSTLDKFGYRNIQFVRDVLNVAADVLVISGGDPFAIFSHIQKKGVSRIRKFIEQGGTYIGVCAGAYFALQFHENPYPWLNMVRGSISNYAETPPRNTLMPHKYTVPYREGFVFHPVREDVKLQYRTREVTAPLYGGPGMVPEAEGAESLAVYTKFTDKTLFLCEKKTAEDVLLGTSALLSAKAGKGHLLLFGPHFEHPYFAEANQELITLLSRVTQKGTKTGTKIGTGTGKGKGKGYPFHTTGTPLTGAARKAWLKELKRWISNGRLASFGLENYYWKIGEKIYDPERLAYFFETCFHITKRLEKWEEIYVLPDLPQEACNLTLRTRKLGSDAQEAEIILERLKKLTSNLYSLYFSTLQQLQPLQKP